MTLSLEKSLDQGIPVLITGACGNTEYWLRNWLSRQYSKQANILKSNTGHPDIQVIDSRDTDTDTVREIRSSLLNYPANLDHRYLVVKNIEALHRSASSSLLKTLEEPLDHVRIVLTSRVPRFVLPTIVSRVLEVSMPRFDREVLTKSLDIWGLEDVSRRVLCCDGDIEIARNLNITVLNEWEQSWSTWVAGKKPDVQMFYHWSQVLPDQNLDTLSSCCTNLINSIVPKMWGSGYWRQVGEITLKLKGKVVRRSVAKQELGSRLFDLYALVKTANARGT